MWFVLMHSFQYQYNTIPASGIIHTLIRITVNTIEAKKHQCKQQEEMFASASPMIHRNRGKLMSYFSHALI